MFFIGLLPALVTLWIQRGVTESDVWLESRRATAAAPRASIRDVFSGRFAATTALLTLLSTATIFAYWGLNLWVPAYLSLPIERGGLALGTTWTTFLVVTMQIGTFFGYVSFGYVADAIGRRKTFIAYILIAAALTLVYSVTRNAWLLLAIGPLVAFFGTGFFSGFGVVTAEIYPTSIRAIAQGFTFNVGRLASAAAPFLIGSMAETARVRRRVRNASGRLARRRGDVDLAPGDARAKPAELNLRAHGLPLRTANPCVKY